MREQRIELLEAELARVRAGALMDLQNLQTDLVAKNRRIGQLEAELARQSEDSPEAGAAKELLLLWRDEIKGGRKNVDIALDSDRGRAMLKALKSKKPANGHDAKERVRRAILGCSYDDWAMGRTAKQDRPYNDVAKHILRDSDRFEHFEDLYAKHRPDPPKLQVVPAFTGPLERVLSRVVKFSRDGTDRFVARCPVCDVRDGSLCVRLNVTERGEYVALDCYGAGCPEARIVEALGLGLADLVSTDGVDRNAPAVLPEHLRVAMRMLLTRGVVGVAA